MRSFVGYLKLDDNHSHHVVCPECHAIIGYDNDDVYYDEDNPEDWGDVICLHCCHAINTRENRLYDR